MWVAGVRGAWGVLVGMWLVDAVELVFLVAGCVSPAPFTHTPGFGVVWCGVGGASPRPISTGRLGIAAVHLRPIDPLFWWGPYPRRAGWETSS